jgi:hypothetical protein
MTTTYRPAANQLLHAFANDVAAPAERLFPLLCPVREYEWIEGWTCRLVHTSSGLVEPGCVFVTDRPGGSTTWVTVEHDPVARRVAFVRVTPERRAVHMALRVEPVGPARSRLHVAWRVSGIDAEGREAARSGTEDGRPYAEIAAGIAAAAERFLLSGRALALAPGARID